MPAVPSARPSPARALTAYAALDCLVQPAVIVTKEGGFVYLNSAFEAALELSRRSLTQTCLFDWLEEGAALREGFAGITQSRFASWRFEGHLRRARGAAVKSEIVISAALGAGHFVVEFIGRGQQERAEREERLLEQTQSSGDFARNLAHEIRNPLGGIRGAAQLLQMERALPGDNAAAYLDIIVQEVDRLQTLVDRLLAPHSHPFAPEPVNIHEICERVLALIRAEFPALSVRRDYDISLPDLHADAQQLIQALLNIARNAAQALEAGGAGIAGEAPRLGLRSSVARHATFAQRHHKLAVKLEVEDNGPGIPAALQAHLFQPLVSGREGGTGLGLMLAQAYIQRNGGVAECTSRPGCTLFTLWLPLAS